MDVIRAKKAGMITDQDLKVGVISDKGPEVEQSLIRNQRWECSVPNKLWIFGGCYGSGAP